MKSLVFHFLLMVLLCTSIVQGTSQCPKGIVHLYSDETIQSFVEQYPNCSELDSSLIVGPLPTMRTTRITDISDLRHIRIIHGDLKITANPFLKSAAALESVEVVDGEFILGYLHKDAVKAFRSKLIKVGRINWGNIGSRIGLELHFDELVKAESLFLTGDKFDYDPFPSLWKVEGNLSNYVSGGSKIGPIFNSLVKAGGLTFYINKQSKYLYPILEEVDDLILYGGGDEITRMPRIVECDNLSIRGNLSHNITGLMDIDSLKTLYVEMWSPAITESLKSLQSLEMLTVSRLDENINHFDFRIKTLETLECSDPKSFLLANALDTISDWTYKNSKYPFQFDKIKEDLMIEDLAISKFKGEVLNGSLICNVKNLSINYNDNLKKLEIDCPQPLGKLSLVSNKMLEDISKSSFKFSPEGKVSFSSIPMLVNCMFDGVCTYLSNGGRISMYNSTNDEACTQKSIIELCK